MKKIVNITLTVIFFVSMFFLTISARSIHNSMLPNVTVQRLTQEEFEFTFIHEELGEIITNRSQLAIPKELYDKGEVYILTVIYINGERRDAVRRVFPQIGEENEGFYEVTGGIGRGDFLVFESNKELTDGVEVLLQIKTSR